MNANHDALLETVRRGYRAGLCLIPPTEDGTKAPESERLTEAQLATLIGEEEARKRCGDKDYAYTWVHYQHKRPSADRMAEWYRNGDRSGAGIVCGAISGNVELFEFETIDVYQSFKERAKASDLDDVVERIEAGYLEATPGGGIHWFYRCDEISGNTKLALRPGPPDAAGRPTTETLIETRGEGGFGIIAPTNGRVHSTGGCYQLLQGDVTTFATITPDERQALWHLAASFDEMPERDPDVPIPTSPPRVGKGEKPGEDYNRRGDWNELLARHGWQYMYSHGDEDFYRRPGKPSHERGHSAKVYTASDGLRKLVVYSTSAHPFEAHRSGQKIAYSLWRAYALLEHNGVFTAAASELGKRRYGEQSPKAHIGDRKEQLSERSHDPVDDDAESPHEGQSRPEINVGEQDLTITTPLAWAALTLWNNPPFIFRQGGQPARIERGDTGRPTTKPLTEDRARYELAQAADWFRMVKKENEWERRGAAPPMAVVKNVLATPNPPFPVLEMLTEAPVFAPDGTFSLQAGYHAATRHYYEPAPGLVIPEVPMLPRSAHIAEAVSWIDDLIGDFPFVAHADRAHAIALLLLPFVRQIINGPTPLHLFDKPQAGTGASLLVDALMMAAIGRAPASLTAGRDEEEWRKRITSTLRSGVQIVLIDNVRERLDSAALSSAITTLEWTDRILGKTENITVPMRLAWAATGNNPALSSELVRRTVRIHLDAQIDRPWERQGFRHANLREWALEHRGQLVWSALTIVRAWFAAGQPAAPQVRPLGSFEAWSHTIGGILSVARIPGFLSNLERFYDESDEEGANIRAFLLFWWEIRQTQESKVSDLFPLATSQNSMIDLGNKGEQSQRVRLGQLLRSLRDRRYQIRDDLTVKVKPAGEQRHAQLWQLENVSTSAPADGGDDDPNF